MGWENRVYSISSAALLATVMLVHEFPVMRFLMRVKLLSVILCIICFAMSVQADTAVKCTFKTLGSCPKIGCSKPNTPLAVTNGQKRSTAINGSPAEISFSDLRVLQSDVEKEFPATIEGEKINSYHSMKAAPRKILLSGLSAGSGKFSEGDYVELSGFIASTKLPPHPNTGESVNCKLKDEPSNDYHINITEKKSSDETQGVVVEMIPQDPHRKSKDWNLTKLKTIQEKQLPVKIQGRLFFDSEHAKNPTGNAGSNPRRFSVWEIHPLSAFFVCPSGSCTKNTGWKALEDWEP
jgi:hypothetical protein